MSDESSSQHWLRRIWDRLVSGVNQGTPNAGGALAWPMVSEVASVVKKSVTVTASGPTTLRIPTGTNKIRVSYFGYSAGADTTGNLVGLILEGYENDDVFDQQYLKAPGQAFGRNIAGGEKYIEGEAGGLFIVTQSVAQTTYVNYEIEEVP